MAGGTLSVGRAPVSGTVQGHTAPARSRSLAGVTDLVHDDPVLGPAIVTFDGRILELFTRRGGSEARLLVGLLSVDVGEPNRKGRREVMFSAGTERRGGGFALWAQEEQWAAVEPFVREVEAAVAAASPPPAPAAA
jgi:hypothetical protein